MWAWTNSTFSTSCFSLLLLHPFLLPNTSQTFSSTFATLQSMNCSPSFANAPSSYTEASSWSSSQPPAPSSSKPLLSKISLTSLGDDNKNVSSDIIDLSEAFKIDEELGKAFGSSVTVNPNPSLLYLKGKWTSRKIDQSYTPVFE